MSSRSLDVSPVGEYEAKAIMCVHGRGVQPDRFRIMVDGLRRLPFSTEHRRYIVVKQFRLGLDPQGRPQFLDRLVDSPLVPRWTPKTGQSSTPENRPVR